MEKNTKIKRVVGGKILFYYCLAFSLLFFIGTTFLSFKQRGTPTTLLLFLPIFIYFVLQLKSLIKTRENFLPYTSLSERKVVLLIYLIGLFLLLGYTFAGVFASPLLSPQDINSKDGDISTNLSKIIVPNKLVESIENKPQESTPEAGLAPKIEIVVKTDNQNGTVNIRQDPNPNSPVVGRVGNGEHYEIIVNNKAGWYQIELDNGKLGWIDYNFTETIR